MSDPWELILHHSYTGTPGVIFDQSPARKSPGTPVGLSDGDFLADGAAAGSGAIQFHPNTAVQVVPVGGWTKLNAVRCEIVCERPADGHGVLIDAGSFKFYVSPVGKLDFSWVQASGHLGWNSSDEGLAPSGRWMTLGVFYDGVGRQLAFLLDGVEIARLHGQPQMTPLSSSSRAIIGNNAAGSTAWAGRIDDVKVWRLDPQWVDNSFTDRPVDPAVRDCWTRWRKALDKALRADPECGARVIKLINDAVLSIIRRAAGSAPVTKATWLNAATEYQQQWPTGDLNAVAAALEQVIAAIGGELQLTTDPAILALTTDPCVRRLLDQLPKLDCDPKFTDVLIRAAKQVEALS